MRDTVCTPLDYPSQHVDVSFLWLLSQEDVNHNQTMKGEYLVENQENQGPMALLLRLQYEFLFGINIA